MEVADAYAARSRLEIDERSLELFYPDDAGSNEPELTLRLRVTDRARGDELWDHLLERMTEMAGRDPEARQFFEGRFSLAVW